MRLAHPGLAAGGDVEPAAAAELVAGPRTEASRRSGTGAAATGRGVEPDVLPTAGVRLADRTRTFTPPAPGDLSTPSKIAAARVAEDDEALRPDGGVAHPLAHGGKLRRRSRASVQSRRHPNEPSCRQNGHERPCDYDYPAWSER